MKKPVLIGSALTLLAGLTFASMSANSAALVNDALVLGENTFQDRDGDRVLRDGEVLLPADYDAAGNFQVGDILEAVLVFDSINGLTPIQQGLPATYDLLAYSQLEIASLTLNLGADGVAGGTGVNADFYDVIYKASGNLGANVLVAVYENNDGTFVNFGNNPTTSVAYVLAQDLIATFGYGEADDFWSGALPLTIAQLELVGQGTGVADNASGVFGLSLLSNPGSLPIGKNAIQSDVTGTFHDLVGNASAKERSTGYNSNWIVETDTQAKFVTVPEPGTLLLMGVGLLGAGFARKRASA
jgi:hypothetical protein